MKITSRWESIWSRLRALERAEITMLAVLLFAAGLVWGFVSIADEVIEGETEDFDNSVLALFRTPGNPGDLIGPAWVEEMGRDVTALGSYAFLGLLFFIVIGYLLMLRKRAAAVMMTVSVLGGVLISNLLKTGFNRPRPDIPHAAEVFTASFPSGHATLSAVVFLTIGALLTRVQAERPVKIYFMAVALLLTILVGLSRLYLGVHYPTDIIAGWCIGAAWAMICSVVFLWLQRRGKVEGPGRTEASSSS